MDKKTNTNRLEYLDLYRGIGIFAMVLGHIYIGALFDQFIHAFHMPMFFIVSGFFISGKEPFFEFFFHKIKKLLIPYIVCSFLILGIY